MTNARFASLHGLPVAPSPSRRRPFRFSNRALVTSFHIAVPQTRRLPSVARRRALRSGYDSLNTSLRSPLHFPRSPTTDRSQNLGRRGKVRNSPISDWPTPHFPTADRIIGEPFVSLWCQRDETALDFVASAFASRILRVARLNARASVPPCTRPPPPGKFCL